MCKFAQVLIASSAQQLDRLFDYAIPPEFKTVAAIGARVIVPFQNRPQLGYIWRLTEHSDVTDLKSISQVVDVAPLITKIQYQLVEWMADYYYCTRSEVVKLCLPPGSTPVRSAAYRLTVTLEELKARLARKFSENEIAMALVLLTALPNETAVKEWEKKFVNIPEIWEFLNRNRLLVKEVKFIVPKIKAKISRVLRWAAADLTETSAAGKRVRDALLGEEALTRSQLCVAAAVSNWVIDRLIREGKIICSEMVQERKPIGFEEIESAPINCRFTPEQQKTYQQLHRAKDSLFLLHGVTGSGKTEIYLEMASEALAKGLQVLYLVPEISLTPQTLERARRRFGDQVALLHSNLSDGERYDQWFNIKNGKANLILGARSALFAPFERLGLIIVDEEHESSYKQEETPKYHTRTVVEKLAELTGARVIFGSATPSIESFYAAQNGNFYYLSLEERYNQKPLPEVSIVDMREELRRGNKNILSNLLAEAIGQSLSEQEQVILLLNRRGYSTFVLCRDCGHSLICPECDVALTYHLSGKVLRCHYCGHRQPVPNFCPQCKSSRIRYFGHGTQKLEEELTGFYKGARIVRMDLDSTSRKGAHYQVYQELITGKVDILLGTQMVAKGLDLPRVTLVGVISADSTLNIPDFRAAERTFQLLTQVAGRAGRSEKTGRVIFQTYNPDHYALQFAKKHDYHGFYNTEIERRRELNYPPFAELVKIGFSGINLEKVREAAEAYGGIIRECLNKLINREGDSQHFIELMGPAPALIPKLGSNYRWQLLLKSNQKNWLSLIVKESWTVFPFRKFAQVRIVRDRNPYSVI